MQQGRPSGFPSLRAKQGGGSFITPHPQNSDRYVKGSHMEDDSLIEEEQGSAISFASFSSKRPVPVPPAPRATHIMKRGSASKGPRTTKGKPFKNRISDLSDTHSKRLPENLQRPPFMQRRQDQRHPSPFEPDTFTFKKNPHETIVTKLYGELVSLQQQERLKADMERLKAQKRRSLSPTGEERGRQTILSMHQSVGSSRLEPAVSAAGPAGMHLLAAAALNAVQIGDAGKGIVTEVDMMQNADISQDKQQGEGGAGITPAEAEKGQEAAEEAKEGEEGASPADEKKKEESEQKAMEREDHEQYKEENGQYHHLDHQPIISLLDSYNQLHKSDREGEERSQASSSVVVDSTVEESKELEPRTLEELEAAYSDRKADFEKIRAVVKGWMLAFEEAFGRAPDRNDRLGEKVMFRNFNDAKSDMEEALGALEKMRGGDALDEGKGETATEGRAEVEGGVSQLTLDDGIFAPVFAEQHDPFYQEHPQHRQSGHVYDGNLGGGAFLVVAGEVASENRRVHYRVLEYYGTCFSIEFTVLSTHQNWTLFVPSSNEIAYLLRIWHMQAKPENSIKLGEWMLRCAKLSFYEDTITAGIFDTNGFRKKCREETKLIIVNAAITVQNAWRRYLAVQYFQAVSRRRIDIEKGLALAKLRSAIRNIITAREAVVKGSAVALRTRMKGVSFTPQPAVLTVDPYHATDRYAAEVTREIKTLYQLFPGVTIFHEGADPTLLGMLNSLMEGTGAPDVGNQGSEAGSDDRDGQSNPGMSIEEEPSRMDFGSNDGWSSPGGGAPQSYVPATMPARPPQGGQYHYQHKLADDNYQHVGSYGDAVQPEHLDGGGPPPRGTKSAHARINNVPVIPSVPTENMRSSGGGVRSRRNVNVGVSTSSKGSPSPSKRQAVPGSSVRSQSQTRGVDKAGSSQASLNISFKDFSRGSVSSPSVTRHDEADKNLVAEMEDQKVHFEESMHELKSDLGAALDGMDYEFRSIRKELEATRAMAYNGDLINSGNEVMSGGIGQSGGPGADISSQMSAMQSQLTDFEEQLIKEKEEKRLLKEQVAELKLKEMTVKTGIALKYDQAKGTLASPGGRTGAGAAGGGSVVVASAAAAAALSTGADSGVLVASPTSGEDKGDRAKDKSGKKGGNEAKAEDKVAKNKGQNLSSDPVGGTFLLSMLRSKRPNAEKSEKGGLLRKITSVFRTKTPAVAPKSKDIEQNDPPSSPSGGATAPAPTSTVDAECSIGSLDDSMVPSEMAQGSIDAPSSLESLASSDTANSDWSGSSRDGASRPSRRTFSRRTTKAGKKFKGASEKLAALDKFRGRGRKRGGTSKKNEPAKKGDVAIAGDKSEDVTEGMVQKGDVAIAGDKSEDVTEGMVQKTDESKENKDTEPLLPQGGDVMDCSDKLKEGCFP